jgi:hypothetical protein
MLLCMREMQAEKSTKWHLTRSRDYCMIIRLRITKQVLKLAASRCGFESMKSRNRPLPGRYPLEFTLSSQSNSKSAEKVVQNVSVSLHETSVRRPSSDHRGTNQIKSEQIKEMHSPERNVWHHKESQWRIRLSS